MPFYVAFQIDELLCAQGSMARLEAETDEDAITQASEMMSGTMTAECGIEVWQGPRLVYRTELTPAEMASPAE